MLPVPVMQELSRLQDNITPFDTAAARAVIETDLGQPINTIFSEFSERPIAAASLAQVGTLLHCLVTQHGQDLHLPKIPRSLPLMEEECFSGSTYLVSTLY